MRTFHLSIFLLLLVLPACAGTRAGGLFQSVREIRPDGKTSPPLAEKDLSPFQQLLRQDFPAPSAPNMFGQVKATTQPAQVFALEVDIPGNEGDGSAGGYLAVIREGQSMELRYYEQSDHRPRTDRYYHRVLTDEERAGLEAFLQAHPLAQLRVPAPVASAPAAVADTQPTTPPGTEPADAAGSEGDSGTDGFQFRLTDAKPGQALTLVLAGPVANLPPAAELLGLLRQLKNAGGFACTYVRSIPLTARPLFADPQRQVVGVWMKADDLRIVVTSAMPDGAAEWLAYRAGRWEASLEPGTEPATELAADPATEPATEPATQPDAENPSTATTPADNGAATTPATTTEPQAAATAPAWEGDNPGMLPTEERWWAQTQTNATVVMHYVPLSPRHGITHGFVVPGLVFDDEHFVVNQAAGMLYLIHDGQLLSLEIPAGARQ